MNTKARHEEIYNTAVAQLNDTGGVEHVNNLPEAERLTTLRRMYKAVEQATGCHYDTAKRNVAKAMRRARYGAMKARWGGTRPNSGRPPKADTE